LCLAPSRHDSCNRTQALYKALHPLVRQPIRWHSVQVQPRADGACVVTLAALERQVDMRLAAEASWQLHDGYFVTTATAHARDEVGECTEVLPARRDQARFR
jgi:hypothetical protein